MYCDVNPCLVLVLVCLSNIACVMSNTFGTLASHFACVLIVITLVM